MLQSEQLRTQAILLVSQLKATDSSHLILVAPQLLDRSRPVEVQHYGYQLLQQLVGCYDTRCLYLINWRHKQLLKVMNLTLTSSLACSACTEMVKVVPAGDYKMEAPAALPAEAVDRSFISTC